MPTDAEKLVRKHRELTHTDNVRVVSHVQRDEDDWVRHTLMLEGIDVPFIFKRKQGYQSLKGARVNLTYYPIEETVAGMPFEAMKVVRIKRS